MKKALIFITCLMGVIFFGSHLFGEVFNINIPAYKLKDNRFEIDGFGSMTDIGSPNLPCKLLLFAIPPNSEVTNCKIDAFPIPVTDSFVITSPLPQLREGKYAEEGRGKREERRESFGEYIGTTEFRNYTLAKIIIFPLSYASGTQQLFYTPNIIIDLDYIQKGEETSPLHSDTVFNDIMAHQIFNFEATKEWYNVDRQDAYPTYNYIIVVSESLKPVVKDFALWKETIGYKVKIISPAESLEVKKILPKYLLVVGDDKSGLGSPSHRSPSHIPGIISGRIPYTEPALVRSILENTIQFELNGITKRVVFVKGVSNYANEDCSGLQEEDKSTLLQGLESVILTNPIPAIAGSPDWIYEEAEGTDIFGEYSMVNFLSAGKMWLWDDGDGIPEFNEIEVSKFNLHSSIPFLVFAPFSGAEFLRQGAICVIAPEPLSKYTVGWRDSLDGGTQSFNYAFLKALMEKEVVGDAFLVAKLWYSAHFPQDSLNTNAFKILGDPSLCLKKRAGVDIGISDAQGEWIPKDTSRSPICWVSNLGIKPVFNCNVYCEIEAYGIPMYNDYVVIDTLEPMGKRLVMFREWNTKECGIPFVFKFESFLPYDENPENDTFRVTSYVRAGDYLIFTKDSIDIIDSLLHRLNYKGAKTDEICSLYPYLSEFSSLFMCDVDNQGQETFPTNYNIYIEGNNLWLSNLVQGEVTKKSIGTQISGKGFSIICSDSINREWFIPDDCVPIFTDSTGELAGFCYEDGYKIWCTRFKFSEIEGLKIALLDSVMHFFGIEAKTEHVGADSICEEVRESNILSFQSTPNPFYDRTFIRFVIRESSPELDYQHQEIFPTSGRQVGLSVYDLTGKLIKNLAKEVFLPGEHQVEWDACDKDGKPVVNGIYFLRIQMEKEKHLLKLIVLR